jgi:hypothetical protein
MPGGWRAKVMKINKKYPVNLWRVNPACPVKSLWAI